MKSKSDLVPPLISQLYLDCHRLIFNKGGYGLNAIDIAIIDTIKPKRNGFFVELGANDGIRQSNTYLLQMKHDWSGVLIEPSPARYEECVNNRKHSERIHIHCSACVPFGYSKSYVDMENSDLMSVAHNLDVSSHEAKIHAQVGSQFLRNRGHLYTYFAKAQTLTDILSESNAPSSFDFLSLDVEGNELSVLRGLDFDRYTPMWILAEIRDEKVGDYIIENGYDEFKSFSQGQRSDVLFRKSHF